jgi:hypothetical protein
MKMAQLVAQLPSVIPARAGIQLGEVSTSVLDSRLRENDGRGAAGVGVS